MSAVNTHRIPHCSALLGDIPVPITHHPASSFTPARVHCTLHSVSRTTYKCSQARVRKDLFKLFKPTQELQPDEDV